MIAPFIYGSTASLHCAALPYLYSWESGIGRHWCVCRGGACPARPRSGKRTAKSIGCTAVSAVPPDVSLRGGHRPTWRPEREARGSALGVQSREGTADLERLSLKWYVPIASVAAVTAQPLAALPPYGCGVPLAGSDRPVRDYSTAGGHWCTTALPDVSLRGRFAPVAISGRQLRFRRRLSCDLVGYCEIATSLRSSQ